MTKNSLIEIVDEKDVNWKDAIKMGVDILVQNKIATSDLASAIIKSTEELGPYYILMPNVALAHTSPGPYNKKVGLSLVVFKKPVSFSKEERHKVSLLFTLSAIDSDSHMTILQKFANTFSSVQNLVEEALKMKSKDDISELFKGVL